MCGPLEVCGVGPEEQPRLRHHGPGDGRVALVRRVTFCGVGLRATPISTQARDRPALNLNPDVVADAGEVDIVALVGRDIATDIFLHMPCGGGSKMCEHLFGNQPRPW